MGADLERLFQLEARELIEALAQGLLSLERDGKQPELVAECYRFAHTLKGAARAVRRTDVSELAHTMEEALSPYRQSGDPMEPDCASDLLKLLELLRTELEQRIEKPPSAGSMPGGPLAAPTPGADRFATVRVELADLDALLSSLTETRTQLRGLRGLRERLLRMQHSLIELLESDPPKPETPPEPSSARERQRTRTALAELRDALVHVEHDVGNRLGRAEQELQSAHELLGTLRLLRVSTMFPSLELAVRDAAQLLGKQVELVCDGGDLRVEANILSGVGDALLHMVRNAVDHGIEQSAVRSQRGKGALGRIRVSAQRRGSRIAFICADDGGGIDLEAVRAAALSAQAISREEAAVLDPEETTRLIFRPGVSTSREVTQVSGRGVGLDIVRAVASRLSGEVSVRSARGQGSELTIVVPTSLSSLTALLLAVDTSHALLPLSAVCGAQRVSSAELITQEGRQRLLYDGVAIPFLPLGPLLGCAVTPRERWSVVIAQSGSERLALGADRIEGTREVLVKPLPAATGPLPLLAGATFDEQGDPLPVLDVRGVFAASRGGVPAAPGAPALHIPAVPRRLPILVIDDSLTTRTLEQSVLEVAGYEVDLASSAEEGLTKARARRYGLFIVDIEMPGMSGLEFTELTRADAVLQKVPVILVTSLASAEYRSRGMLAGASAYIVKSEFDQGIFLHTVNDLLRSA